MRGKNKFYCLIKEEGYTLHSEFKNCNEHVYLTHNECGHKYKVQVVAFNKGRRCPKCARNLKLKKEEVKNRLKEKGFLLIGEYINANEKLLVKHIECENEWMVKVSKIFYQNRGCPECKFSHGESFIRRYLKENNIRYKREKRFNDCRNELPLPFDFYLLDLNTVIEYHGEQHYKCIDFFGGEEGFNKRRMNDEKKRNYCKEKGIEYIELSYKLDNYEKVKNKLDEVFTNV